MVHLNMTARYILTNSLLDSTQVLSSTRANDSLMISNGDGSDSQLWYFTEGNTSTTYRLHTVEKGDYYALDVFNYIGHSTIDLHFFSTGDYNGQIWTVDDEANGTVKLSNGFTGPDMYLEVMGDSLAVQLAGGDSKGQYWTLSQWYGSFVSPTTTASSTASSTGSHTAIPTTLITTGVPTFSCASSASACLASVTATSTLEPAAQKGGLKTGPKVGIAVGVVVVAAVALGLLIFCLCKRPRRDTTPTGDEVSEVDRAGRLGD